MTQSKWFQTLVQYGGLLLVLMLLMAVFSVSSNNFFQTSTLVTIANQIPDLTFLAVGMTLVLIVGGIDLSVGSLLALSSAVLGVLMAKQGWSIGTALAAAMLVAALCGTINGVISVGFGIPPFIVTLGMLEIARGATKVVSDSQSVYIGSRVEWFGQPIGGLQLSPAFVVAVLAVMAGQFVLTRTVFGRYCVAIGTNDEAVRMSGIRSAPYAIAVFGISGLMCGLAGLAQTSRLSTADPNGAIGIELAAIAACVIGGTSLMGGRGSVISSFIGVLIMQVLQTGLAQIGVSDANKQIITGTVIVIAVLLDALRIKWGNEHEVVGDLERFSDRDCGTDHDRPSWDLTSVLYAVRPDDGYFKLSKPGRVSVADDGFTTFQTQPKGRDRYLILDENAVDRVVATQRLLASQPPVQP